MQIKYLKDRALLEQTKTLVQSERELLTKVLHHLREIDRRKLYSDLRYGSLFEYAVKELKYSESQAARRIQAMRLIKEIPQVEKSIASGELSLSNVSQAQSLFRNQAKAQPEQAFTKADKVAVLKSLKNTSTREGQKKLLGLMPQQELVARTFEKERAVSETAAEVRFLMTDKLKEKLEQVRALLGPKAIDMGYSELFEAMADLSVDRLAEKKFGKKRAAKAKSVDKASVEKIGEKDREFTFTPAQEEGKDCSSSTSKNKRYIPQRIKHAVWQRDGGCCTKCGTQRNLNYDHIRPVGRNGSSTEDNLRLLCHHCNQREAIRAYGMEHQSSWLSG